MLGSDVLDIALGMIFVYLILSLVASAANELVEAWLRNRSRDLEAGLRELLADEQGTGLVQQLYSHPLIAGLFRGSYVDAKSTGKLPSYIPSRDFALALLDMVLPASAASPSGASSATVAPDGKTPPDAKGADVFARLRTAIAGLGNAETSRALLALADAGGTVAKARENIEAWYNSAMDRVSGWYKRRTHWLLLASGFVLAAVINADSIAIAQRLSVDRPLREALVAASSEYAKAGAATATNSPAEERLKSNLTQLRDLGLPLGWTLTKNDDPRSVYIGSRWIVRIIGWLLTACAVSMGAPFWFDLLNKVSVVRSTVKPKEKSPDEPAKG